MKTKIFKSFIVIIIGAIVGYMIYFQVLMEVISHFCSGNFYIIISFICLFLCVVGCISLIYIFINREINKYIFIPLVVAYICLLIFVLYGRTSIGRIFILNPLVGIRDLQNSEMFLESTLNAIIFIPFGFFLKNLKKIQMVVMAIIIPVLIEFTQVITMRGMFDTFDILLYFIGINIGVLVFKNYKFKIV